MEGKRLRIFCIHGYKGKAENLTYRGIKKLLPNAEVIAEEYDLTDHEYLFKRIEEMNPDILVGNSLGGFYVMAYNGECKKIVVNPCLIPSNEIPKLDSNLPKTVIDCWKRMEQRVLVEGYKNIFGVFASDDELFRFKDMFDCLCGDTIHSILVKGTHVLKNPGLTEGLTKAIEELKIV